MLGITCPSVLAIISAPSFQRRHFSAISPYPTKMSMYEGRSYRRGRGRGRGLGFRGSWRGNRRNSLWMEPPAPMKGPVLARIYEDDLTDDSNVDNSTTTISECTEVASFNLLNEKEPTILVPG